MTAPKTRFQAAEIGRYEVLERHNFHTVASSQSFDTVALMIKIMNILHVNVAQKPASVGDPLRRECSSLLALYLLIMQRYLLLAINAIEALLATVVFPYPS